MDLTFSDSNWTTRGHWSSHNTRHAHISPSPSWERIWNRNDQSVGSPGRNGEGNWKADSYCTRDSSVRTYHYHPHPSINLTGPIRSTRIVRRTREEKLAGVPAHRCSESDPGANHMRPRVATRKITCQSSHQWLCLHKHNPWRTIFS